MALHDPTASQPSPPASITSGETTRSRPVGFHGAEIGSIETHSLPSIEVHAFPPLPIIATATYRPSCSVMLTMLVSGAVTPDLAGKTSTLSKRYHGVGQASMTPGRNSKPVSDWYHVPLRRLSSTDSPSSTNPMSSSPPRLKSPAGVSTGVDDHSRPSQTNANSSSVLGT